MWPKTVSVGETMPGPAWAQAQGAKVSLIPAETDKEVLEVKSNAEAQQDAAAVYKGVLCKLRSAHDVGVPLQRLCKRWCTGGAEGEVDEDESGWCVPMCLHMYV
jgi:hypothetical protein